MLHVPVPIDPAVIGPGGELTPGAGVGRTALVPMPLSPPDAGLPDIDNGSEAMAADSWLVAELERFVELCRTQREAVQRLVAPIRTDVASRTRQFTTDAHRAAARALEVATTTSPEVIERFDIGHKGRRDAVIDALIAPTTDLARASKLVHEEFGVGDGPIADIVTTIGPPGQAPQPQHDRLVFDHYFILSALCPDPLRIVDGYVVAHGEHELALLLLAAQGLERRDQYADAVGQLRMSFNRRESPLLGDTLLCPPRPPGARAGERPGEMSPALTQHFRAQASAVFRKWTRADLPTGAGYEQTQTTPRAGRTAYVRPGDATAGGVGRTRFRRVQSQFGPDPQDPIGR